MRQRRLFIMLPGVLLVLVTLNARLAVAQSTLFNAPTTDTTAKKTSYAEFDFTSHLQRHADGGFQIYVPRAMYGIGRRTEVGVNVAFTDELEPRQPVEVQPNVKYRFYENESHGTAAAVGGVLYLTVAHRAGTHTDAMIYTALSKTLRADHGPRFTGGAYALVGHMDGHASKGGAILGYEQPLVRRRLNFVADWLSGRNRCGYATPGFSYVVSRRSVLYAGYSIGNEGRKNNALFLYYGISF